MITDNDIITNLVLIRNSKALLNTCRIKKSWLLDHGYYEYLINRYSSITNILEIIYRIYYNIPDSYKMYCKTCGKEIPLLFKGFLLGYTQYCSYKCSINDPNKLKIKYDLTVTDDIILNKVIDNNGKLISDYCLKRKLIEFGFYDYMMKRYNNITNILEILYRMKNNIEETPKCPVCGNNLPFYRFSEGYRKHCSNVCANKDKKTITLKIKSKQETIENKWLNRGYNIKYNNDETFTVYNLCNLHNPFIIKNYIFFNRIKTPYITLCPICNPERNTETSIETLIKNILDENNIIYELHNRKIISPKELDFYLPEHKLAIECNGIYWHNGEDGKLKTKLKYELSDKANILLLTFWEDNICYDIEKVKQIILSRCGLNKRIYGRLCQIKEIDSKTSKVFLDNYHLQGNVNAKVKLGLFYNNELMMVMTFGKMRKCLGHKNNKDNIWELYRLCSKSGYTVIGGASKLLKYFMNNYEYDLIISYCHKEISNGNVYKQLGFIFDKDCGQGYSYYNYKISKHRINRYSLRKNIIDDNSGRTADEILYSQGYYKCYDAGVMKFIIKKCDRI